MISVKEALDLIKINTKHITEEVIPLCEAFDRVLSQDVYSAINMPPFDQSAMDGYAVNYSDDTTNSFKVIGEIKAGDDATSVTINEGEAVRIFTGAMVPETAVTVIKQEIVERNGDQIDITEDFVYGANIRRKGEQVEKGGLAAVKGTTLTPGTVGYLAGLGIDKVNVSKLPGITIIVTGSELITADEELTPGKIYESNAIMLQAALHRFGLDCNIDKVKDDYSSTKEMIAGALQNSDVLLLSGGISVGDYDFVAQALEELGTEKIFHRIKQKPGKPLYYGKNKHTSIFALPGNPASALSCFYVYVAYALQLICGNKDPFVPMLEFELSHDFEKKGSLTHFLKARVTEGKIAVLSAQSSAMLSAFTSSNALMVIPEDTNDLKEGIKVKAYFIS